MGADFLKCFQRKKKEDSGAARLRNIEGGLEQKHCGKIIFRARSP
jgi:hypothetical protein